MTASRTSYTLSVTRRRRGRSGKVEQVLAFGVVELQGAGHTFEDSI